ncbi:ATPase [Artemisia annua]|uniref:Midasin n=1 Tax=Artemisia annua TaxID=35608 RepID=A0A2U1QDU7_ARTAN|nr:ATPase [Artemisia annua]
MAPSLLEMVWFMNTRMKGSLPVDASSTDFVVSISKSSDFPGDKFFEEFTRVWKPGGEIVIHQTSADAKETLFSDVIRTFSYYHDLMPSISRFLVTRSNTRFLILENDLFKQDWRSRKKGLNAILDHRAKVFIPELGHTFKCPSSFRVFACQNPTSHYSGGGRNGLPKSFLNRFTKVYVDDLVEEGYLFICRSLHFVIDPKCFPWLVDEKGAFTAIGGHDKDSKCFSMLYMPQELLTVEEVVKYLHGFREVEDNCYWMKFKLATSAVQKSEAESRYKNSLFQAAPAPLPPNLAGWMPNPPVHHSSASAGPIIGFGPLNDACIVEGLLLPVYSVCPHFKENIQFFFSTAIDGQIKAYLYDNEGPRVNYNAPGQSSTKMAYSADGTRLFSCGTNKQGDSFIVEWNETEGTAKGTYNGFGKQAVGVVQFDTTKTALLLLVMRISPFVRFNKDGMLLAVSIHANGIKILANPDGVRLLRTTENRSLDAYGDYQQGFCPFSTNIAVTQNNPLCWFKLSSSLATLNIGFKHKYYLAFAALAGCNVVLATCAGVQSFGGLLSFGSGLEETPTIRSTMLMSFEHCLNHLTVTTMIEVTESLELNKDEAFAEPTGLKPDAPDVDPDDDIDMIQQDDIDHNEEDATEMVDESAELNEGEEESNQENTEENGTEMVTETSEMETEEILLEGSSCVGKTSLVLALGKYSGHSVVRINLSEQTDMMDLLGSDLPGESDEGMQFAWSDGILLQALKNGSWVLLDELNLAPQSVLETDMMDLLGSDLPGESDEGMQFAWSDGILLQAPKNGSWVLLDELNLAPQSVLEGLNAILDHRAKVFIPELGHTFRCPSSFRVFVCQNPTSHYSGGGRDGLPKSFLNRFTKVYVDDLVEEGYLFICRSLHFVIDPKCFPWLVDEKGAFTAIGGHDKDSKCFSMLYMPQELLKVVGARVRILENDLFKQDWRSRKKVQIFQYVFMKWTLVLLIGLSTGLVAFFNNIAVENIAGFKLLLTGNLMLKQKYYLAFAPLSGCNVVLATCAGVLCAYSAPAAADKIFSCEETAGCRFSDIEVWFRWQNFSLLGLEETPTIRSTMLMSFEHCLNYLMVTTMIEVTESLELSKMMQPQVMKQAVMTVQTMLNIDKDEAFAEPTGLKPMIQQDDIHHNEEDATETVDESTELNEGEEESNQENTEENGTEMVTETSEMETEEMCLFISMDSMTLTRRALAVSWVDHAVLNVGIEMIKQALGSGDTNSELTWNRMQLSVMLEHVQAHVAPTDVDPGAGLQWLPKIRRSSKS